MPFPSDIKLSPDAKYFGIVDYKKPYNLNWDVVWSFTYALTGVQHGFCTFLTTGQSISGLPGQYLGCNNDNFVLSIGFDSTGYFALSSPLRNGVLLSDTKPNSLIIRDSVNNVVFNERLSSLNTDFILASSVKAYQTLRFRYSNAGRKISVDYKIDGKKYSNITSLSISSLNINDNFIVYPGFSFCSPISGLNITPSTMHIQNFHTQGNTDYPTYETTECIPLTSIVPTTFTTISGISAFPMSIH
jgi:hypothetical protein